MTFLDGSSDQTLCTPISIRNDMVLEGDHAFTVTIVGAGTFPHAEVGSPPSTTVTIKDDESRSFFWVQNTQITYVNSYFKYKTPAEQPAIDFSTSRNPSHCVPLFTLNLCSHLQACLLYSSLLSECF